MGRREEQAVVVAVVAQPRAPTVPRATIIPSAACLLLAFVLGLAGAPPAGASQASRSSVAPPPRTSLESSVLDATPGVRWRFDGGQAPARALFRSVRGNPLRTRSAPVIGTTGTISGAVTAAAGKAPLAGIEVCAFMAGELLGEEGEEPPFVCSKTTAVGEYTV
jgi:hypothetical protein